MSLVRFIGVLLLHYSPADANKVEKLTYHSGEKML